MSSDALIPTWRAVRDWQPRLLPSGRIEYADNGIIWRLVDLTPEEHQQEMQYQEDEKLDQEPRAWGAATPQAEPSADGWTGDTWEDGDMHEDRDGDGDTRMEMGYHAPTPFSEFYNDDPGTEQPISSPALASGATSDVQQPSASTAAEKAGSSEGNGDGNGRRRARKPRRVIGPPVEGRRQSSRKRTKTKRMVEEGG
ncbi:hypothetical protein MMC07_000323 [Pseudocyphellaria aurata]|nr:hypothetical protein [Pseudocyphellaria aurata]